MHVAISKPREVTPNTSWLIEVGQMSVVSLARIITEPSAVSRVRSGVSGSNWSRGQQTVLIRHPHQGRQLTLRLGDCETLGPETDRPRETHLANRSVRLACIFLMQFPADVDDLAAPPQRPILMRNGYVLTSARPDFTSYSSSTFRRLRRRPLLNTRLNRSHQSPANSNFNANSVCETQYTHLSPEIEAKKVLTRVGGGDVTVVSMLHCFMFDASRKRKIIAVFQRDPSLF